MTKDQSQLEYKYTPDPAAAAADMMTVTAVVLCFFLALTPAHYAWASSVRSGCCTRYSRMPVPFQLVKGYREQTTMENCHIEAIIFYTVRKNMICASRNDEWVRKLLKLLSSRLRRMSKVSSGVTQKKLVKPGGGGSSFSTTETFTNSTTGFY